MKKINILMLSMCMIILSLMTTVAAGDTFWHYCDGHTKVVYRTAILKNGASDTAKPWNGFTEQCIAASTVGWIIGDACWSNCDKNLAFHAADYNIEIEAQGTQMCDEKTGICNPCYNIIESREYCSSKCNAQCSSGECCSGCMYKSQGTNCGSKDCGGEYLASGKNCLYRTYTCAKKCIGSSGECPDCNCNTKTYTEETKASCSECQDVVCSSSSQRCVDYIEGTSCSAGKCHNGECVVSMTASVWGASPVWQNTNALASVKCVEKIEGECGPSTAYKLKVYSEKPIACSTNYNEYDLESPTNISGHMWACGVAKNSEGKPFFSEPVEFKIDKTITALESKETEESLIYCDAIFNAITRNLCYMTYASEFLEQAVCDYISDIAQKDVCKQKVSLLGK